MLLVTFDEVFRSLSLVCVFGLRLCVKRSGRKKGEVAVVSRRNRRKCRFNTLRTEKQKYGREEDRGKEESCKGKCREIER